jgi:hypothetical protein
MKSEAQPVIIQSTTNVRRTRYGRFVLFIAFALVALPSSAHASFLESDTLDAVCEVIAWVALLIVPIIGICAFWMVHILPEKIAEKKKHPQAKAIQVVCILSLVFGGMLWPFAWLWAYTKPVLHKMAYGTDVGKGHGHDDNPEQAQLRDDERELASLRTRVAELEAKQQGKPTAGTGKA